ncbi:hypothetical protein DITRI_Ditri11bG0081700 [Diplodiscus trichospermus]
MKFNVDGSVIDKPSSAGISGVLKNDKGNAKIVFSKSVGVIDFNVVEALAVKEAFSLFSSSPWALNSKLIIESDSNNEFTMLVDLQGMLMSMKLRFHFVCLGRATGAFSKECTWVGLDGLKGYT